MDRDGLVRLQFPIIMIIIMAGIGIAIGISIVIGIVGVGSSVDTLGC